MECGPVSRMHKKKTLQHQLELLCVKWAVIDKLHINLYLKFGSAKSLMDYFVFKLQIETYRPASVTVQGLFIFNDGRKFGM